MACGLTDTQWEHTRSSQGSESWEECEIGVTCYFCLVCLLRKLIWAWRGRSRTISPLQLAHKVNKMETTSKIKPNSHRVTRFEFRISLRSSSRPLSWDSRLLSHNSRLLSHNSMKTKKTWPDLSRTSKIIKIDPIVTEIQWFANS